MQQNITVNFNDGIGIYNYNIVNYVPLFRLVVNNSQYNEPIDLSNIPIATKENFTFLLDILQQGSVALTADALGMETLRDNIGNFLVLQTYENNFIKGVEESGYEVLPPIIADKYNQYKNRQFLQIFLRYQNSTELYKMLSSVTNSDDEIIAYLVYLLNSGMLKISNLSNVRDDLFKVVIYPYVLIDLIAQSETSRNNSITKSLRASLNDLIETYHLDKKDLDDYELQQTLETMLQ